MACLRRPTAAPGTVSGGRCGGSAGADSVLEEAGVSMESAMRAMGVVTSLRSWRLLRDLVQGVLRRLLSRVRVLGAGVDLELLDLGAAEGVLRQHPADRLLDGPGRVLLEHLRVA